MQEAIRTGTVLFREGTALPEALKFESVSYSPGGRSVRGLDGCALDRKLHDTGWHFFYFAGESRVTVFGGEGQETVRRAIMRILSSLRHQKINSFEITRVALKTFLGVPIMSVSFHPRNMQESMVLLGDETARPWNGARLVAA